MARTLGVFCFLFCFVFVFLFFWFFLVVNNLIQRSVLPLNPLGQCGEMLLFTSTTES